MSCQSLRLQSAGLQRSREKEWKWDKKRCGRIHVCEQSQRTKADNCSKDKGKERNGWQVKAEAKGEMGERARHAEGEKWLNQTGEEEIELIFGLRLISLVVELSAKCQAWHLKFSSWQQDADIYSKHILTKIFGCFGHTAAVCERVCVCVWGSICASFPLCMCLDSQVTQDAVTWKLNLNLSATFSPRSPPPHLLISSRSPLHSHHLSGHLSGNDLCPIGCLQSLINCRVSCVLCVGVELGDYDAKK